MFNRYPKTDTKISRRSFLKASSLAGAGFMVGTVAAPVIAAGDPTTPLPAEGFGHFVKIMKDNTVTVVIKHLDKGQGVTTGLTTIVAEELDADWSQMRWEFAPSDPSRYNNLFWGPYQGTGGSTAVANSWTQLRKAGAGARQMLIDAAAAKWNTSAAKIKVSKGVVSSESGQSATFGELAELASSLSPPIEPKLKTPSQFNLIGKHVPRIDSKEKSTGKAQYTIDKRLPNMIRAVIAHPPKFGATIKSVDTAAAMKIDGVKEVVQTPRGVAVLAEDYWTASQGKAALVIEWDESAAEVCSSDALWKEYKALAEKPGLVARNDGDVEQALNGAEETVTMNFEFPYLAHATMEPMNCVIELKDGSAHVYTGSQIPGVDQFVVSQVTGLPPEKVFIHTLFAGGSFGRRAVPDSDYVMDTAMIAAMSKLGRPVSLQWSREDDIKAGRYRPMTYHKVTASIDADKNITGWHQRIVSQSILRGTPFEGLIKGPIDMVVVEGASTLPYKIPNLKVDGHEPQVGVPVLWWRSVGHTHTGYATEVFFDEVAHKVGKDPVALRMDLLKEHPRHLGVLKLAAEKAQWGKKLPSNKAQGVAVHESFNSYVAQVAEVTLNSDGTFKVDKITCAVDCGVAINPDVVRAQMEGGIAYGLSSSFGEKITLTNGAVDQNNFYDYFPLRIDKMPLIDVHIVESNEAPTGVGEPGTPPASPAVANALRVLTKKAITTLPMPEKLA